jgi:hypothetical protein
MVSRGRASASIHSKDAVCRPKDARNDVHGDWLLRWLTRLSPSMLSEPDGAIDLQLS